MLYSILFFKYNTVERELFNSAVQPVLTNALYFARSAVIFKLSHEKIFADSETIGSLKQRVILFVSEVDM